MSDELFQSSIAVDTSAPEPAGILYVEQGSLSDQELEDLPRTFESLGFPIHLYEREPLNLRTGIEAGALAIWLVLKPYAGNILLGAAGNAAWAAFKTAIGRLAVSTTGGSRTRIVIVIGDKQVRVEGEASAGELEKSLAAVPEMVRAFRESKESS